MTGKRIRVNDGWEYVGFISFVTTGTTVELDVPFKTITAYSLTYVGTPAAAEAALSINEPTATAAISGEVTIPVPADGNVTVTRIAGTTSGITVCFRIRGR